MTMMYIAKSKERCETLARYLVENKATVRAAAAKFGISKSTVHKDVTDTLKRVNKDLYEEVQKILQTNKSERHIRGGEATKNKYRYNL
jgi:putative DeoR family transcriptional regulator (stage III sporulation protein D)